MHSNARGCDPTAMLEIYIVLGVYAASQQTLVIVSSSLSNPMQGEGEQNDVLKVWIVWVVYAASQQTLFIVSTAPSNPMLWEVNKMLCWRYI